MMAIRDEMVSQLNLIARIDKDSLRQTRQALKNLMGKTSAIRFDERQMADFVGVAKSVQDSFASLQKNFPKAAAQMEGSLKGFDRDFTGMLVQLEEANKQYQTAITEMKSATDDADRAAKQQIVMQKRESLDEIGRQMAVLAEQKKAALDAAKSLEKGFGLNLQNMEQAGKFLAEGFTDSLNNLKSGDLSGFVKAFGKTASTALRTGAKYLGEKAKTAETPEAAAGLQAAAKSLTLVSVSVLATVGAIAAVVAILMAADKQTKDFNKTLLEGAGIADLSFRNMENDLEAVRRAAFQLNWEFRAMPEEFVKIASALNQAGVTYKEMFGEASSVEEKQAAIYENVKLTYKASKALGISAAEAADAMNMWTADFGLGLEEIGERFLAIEGIATRTSFNTKRFFTAVSQATAGMALYNIRMDEAAQLLAMTSKILGETDASDFIRSLTKGFVDESITDRIKRIMIAGQEDTQRIFELDASQAARRFTDTISKDEGLQDAMSRAGVNVNLIGDPDNFAEALSKKSPDEVTEILTKLRQEGKNAGARQIEELVELKRASTGDLSDQVKALDNLSMGGKLAMKMQTLKDKRLSEMGLRELAAFEQYAGISGEQLEQLIRMDRSMGGEWTAINKMLNLTRKGQNLTEDQKKILEKQYGMEIREGKLYRIKSKEEIGTLQDYIATSARMEEVATLVSQEEYYMQEMTKATVSVVDLLKGRIQYILEQISSSVLTVADILSGLSDTEAKAKSDALLKIANDQKIIEETIATRRGEILDIEKVIATQGKDAKMKSGSYVGMPAGDAKAEAEKRLKSDIAYLKMSKAIEKGTRDVKGGFIFDLFEKADDVENIGFLKAMKGDAGESLARSILGDNAGPVIQKMEGLGTADSMEILAQALAPVLHPELEEQLPPLLAAFGSRHDRESDSETTKKVAEGQIEAADQNTTAVTNAIKQTQTDAKKTMPDAVEEGTRKGIIDAEKRMAAETLAAALHPGDAVKQSRVTSKMLTGDLSALTGDVQSQYPNLVNLLGGRALPEANDFIWRPGSRPLTFSPRDTLVGAKTGGPLAGAGGSTINITINGGDPAQVYRVVKDALRASGLR